MLRVNVALDPSKTGREAEVLESNLRKLIIGQDEAIQQIVNIYQMHLTGMTPPGRPIASFLFLGPTGSGKTRIVEATAEALVKNPAEARMMIESRLQARVPVKAGPRTIAVTFLQKDQAEDDYILEPFIRTTLDPVNEAGLPHVDQVVISGPYNATGPGDTPSRRKIFACHPANASEEVGCARKILSSLAKHAYRRPITPTDMETLLSFYQSGRNQGGSFDAASSGRCD